MDIHTEFSCGDQGWVFSDGIVQLLTVGRVEVTVTDTPGIEQGGIAFDNYKAAKAYVEKYMCVETGIGSGCVYTLGVHIFRDKDACVEANAQHIAEQERERAERKRRQASDLLAQEASLRLRLSQIEAMRAGASA